MISVSEEFFFSFILRTLITLFRFFRHLLNFLFLNKDKKIQRRITVLQVYYLISQNFEKCLFHQMSGYFEKVYSEYHCEFRQVLGAQYCLMSMSEKLKNSVDFQLFSRTSLNLSIVFRMTSLLLT